jgi:hypothetical protein
MYIDGDLIRDFNKRYPHKFIDEIKDRIEDCGFWYPSIASVQAEWEDFDATLEEICSVYYFIIEENKIKFVSPESFWDDVNEYLNG